MSKPSTPPPVDPSRPAVPVWSLQNAGTLVVVAATVLALYVCFHIVLPLLPALTWALALAVIAYPLHRQIAGHIRSPSAAAGLSLFLIAVVILLPAGFVANRLVHEVIVHVERLHAGATAGRLNNIGEAAPFLATAVEWLGQYFDVRAETQRALAFVATRLTSLVLASLWTLFEMLTTLFALFYFLRDGPAILAKLRSLLPLSDRDCGELYGRVGDVIHATVYGTLFCAALQGTLGGLMFWWLELPAPTLWGLIMALLAIVPYLGAFVVWIPAAVYLAAQGQWLDALLLALWGSVVIGLIDNFTYPILVGKRMRLHALLVFVGLIGGLVLFGASGVIVGPIVLALADGLLVISRQRFVPEARVEKQAAELPENDAAASPKEGDGLRR